MTITADSAPIVLSAPSGAGKTTIARQLVEKLDDFVFSVSATTRQPRPGEVDGHDYHFVSVDEFKRMIREDELLEWAEVHGRYYGTPRRYVEEAARSGRHVMLDIDVQGARQVRRSAVDAILVFILPPSFDVLIQRLTGRGTETDEEVQNRLRTAQSEIEAINEFDYWVINDNLEDAKSAVRAIAKAHRFRRPTTQDGGSDHAARVVTIRREIERGLEARLGSHPG